MKKSKEKTPIKGFKAFNKGLVCKGFQFEEGKTYEAPRASVCQEGFHLCTNPLDVLNYYDLTESEFAEVEALGEIDKNDEDSKLATTKIKIGVRLDLGGFVKACVGFLMETTKPEPGKTNRKSSDERFAQLAASGDAAQLAASGYAAKLAASGYAAQLAASGYAAQLAASGYAAKLAASGDAAKLELNGKNGAGAALGKNSRIKGTVGSWITLAECGDWDGKGYPVLCVRSAQIDGETLKADTWYQLINGEFVEVGS